MSKKIVAQSTRTGLYFNGTNFSGTLNEAKWLPRDAGTMGMIRATWGFPEYGNGIRFLDIGECTGNDDCHCAFCEQEALLFKRLSETP